MKVIMKQSIVDFVTESNRIEQIFRQPTDDELYELVRFMGLSKITIDELKRFVTIYQPDAKLRDRRGLNVRIGTYYPPKGGENITQCLEYMLLKTNSQSAYELHVNYELLHPFTDCNGRSGRALWAWRMQDITGGFLHNFYYQTLRQVSWERE